MSYDWRAEKMTTKELFDLFLDSEYEDMEGRKGREQYMGAELFTEGLIGAQYRTPDEYREYVLDLIDLVDRAGRTGDFTALGSKLYTSLYNDFQKMVKQGIWELENEN
jgi:muconolactone delta-isomerase